MARQLLCQADVATTATKGDGDEVVTEGMGGDRASSSRTQRGDDPLLDDLLHRAGGEGEDPAPGGSVVAGEERQGAQRTALAPV